MRNNINDLFPARHPFTCSLCYFGVAVDKFISRTEGGCIRDNAQGLCPQYCISSENYSWRVPFSREKGEGGDVEEDFSCIKKINVVVN